MVLRERIELSTSPLPRVCSTTELPQPVRGERLFASGEAPIATVYPPMQAGRGGLTQQNAQAAGSALPVAGRIRYGTMMTEMKDRNASGGAGTQKTEAERRAERLAKTLRDNLARRKQQARARRAGAADEATGLPAAKRDESPD